MKRGTRLTGLAALLAAGTVFGASFAAAERSSDTILDQRATAAAAAPAEPIQPQVMVPDIDRAVTDLARDARFDDLPVDWAGILNFYAENGSRALFTTPTGFSELGLLLRARLAVAVAAGLRLPVEVQAALNLLPQPVDAATQADAEALLAAVLIGTAVDATTLLGEKTQEGALLLTEAAGSDAVGFLDRQLPGYYRFWALLEQLPVHTAYYQAGGWPEVPDLKKLEPGQSHPAVTGLRQRLLVTGELARDVTPVAADPVSGTIAVDDSHYDPALVAAVEVFQRNHGLLADGIVGGRTLEELNVSAAQRLRQVLLNLERMRELGPQFETRHLIANIPSQEVKVIENGEVTFFTKAIYGKVQRKSPTLSSVIHTVKLNPDWTVPYKIAAIDEVKRQRKDANFLTNNNFTIYDGNGNIVSPHSINWHEVGPNNFPYTLRQAPGPENALGPVKFDFPNDHSVFLHGTPTLSLFAKQDRFFSSGCVRTEEPVDLAAFMLQQTPDWDRARIDAVLKSGKTTLVKLADPLPVHITYMTAWVDEAGIMQFRKDAYGFDRLPALPSGIEVMVAMAPSQSRASGLRQD